MTESKNPLDRGGWLDRIGKIIRFSQMDGNGNINPDTAVFHTITRIAEAVRMVMGETRKRHMGPILRKELWFGKNVLDMDHSGSLYYAVTREGVQKIIDALDPGKAPKKSVIKPNEIHPPTAGGGGKMTGKAPER